MIGLPAPYIEDFLNRAGSVCNKLDLPTLQSALTSRITEITSLIPNIFTSITLNSNHIKIG